MKFLFSAFILLVFSTSAFSQDHSFTIEDSLRGKLSTKRSCFDVYYYDLAVSVDIKQKAISGSTIIFYKAVEDFDTMQIDLFKNMSISKIRDENGRDLHFWRKANAVFIKHEKTQTKGATSKITIDYFGQPKQAIKAPWDGGFVWSNDSLDRPWVGVACEGIGASLWWPCKDHPSDEPDSMRIRFTVPGKFVCISNGNLTDTLIEGERTTYTWEVQYPINLYNVTLNIGAYVTLKDTFNSTSGEVVPIDYYVLSYNKEKALEHFKQVKPILSTYETLFGPYPFPKDGYALVETRYLGMEHQSAISYGNEFQNNMLGKLDYIIVHETGHEWWGNQVSVADHADLWIHESFTTYGESLLIEKMYGIETAKGYLQKQSFTIKNREVIQGPSNVNFYEWEDSDMYFKGAWMFHSLRNAVANDSLWFSMFIAIQKEFSFKPVRSKEIIDYINAYLGKDYTAFFKQYLEYPKPPVLEYSFIKKEGKDYLAYKWNTDVEGFFMPVKVYILDKRKELVSLNPKNSLQEIELKRKRNYNNASVGSLDYYIKYEKLK